MKRAFLASILVLAASSTGAFADFELLLEDGQLLSGIDVKRKDGQYLLEIEPGHVLSIPYELVVEVRITAGSARGVRKAVPEQLAGDAIPLDGDDRPASGMQKSDPEVLAGDDFAPPRRSEQIEALGEPSRFTESVIDHDWRPGSDWDIKDETEFNPSTWAGGIDNRWQPTSDYTERTDVTEFRPSRWSRGLPLTTWRPEDGFRKKKSAWQRATAGSGEAQLATATSATRRGSVPTGTSVTTCSWCSRFTLAPTSASRRLVTSVSVTERRPSAVEIRSCAEEIFEPLVAEGASSIADLRERQERLVVRWIEDQAFAGLPIRLYEGTWRTDEGENRRAVFAYSEGICQLINGDLDELLGVEVSGRQVGSYATTAFNAVLDPTKPVRLNGESEKIQYALAVSSLLLPGSTDMRVLTEAEHLAVSGDADCRRSRRSRRKDARKLAHELLAPQIEQGVAAETVRFYSWDRLGGVVRSHRVLLSPNGEVSMEIVTIAAHLGEHDCSE